MNYLVQSSAQYAGVVTAAILTANTPSSAYTFKIQENDRVAVEVTNFTYNPLVWTKGPRRSGTTPNFTSVPDALKFRALATLWDEEMGAISSSTEMVMCSAYQQIIGMGPSALPFIFRQLEKERKQPNNWFWALRSITQADPVEPEDRGNRPKMAAAWLRWGKARYAW